MAACQFSLILLLVLLTAILSEAAIEGQVGKKVWVIMRGEKEFTGTLTGYDEFISTRFLAFGHLFCPARF